MQYALMTRHGQIHLGVVWFKKCNANGNDNGFGLITGGNKFE
jgi:hypothetical protein